MDDIILIGYGGHGKSVEDAILSMKKYNIAGYVDMKEQPDSLLPYLGTDEVLKELFENGIRNAAIGVGFMGDSRARDNIYNKLTSIGFELPPVIDPSAIIAVNAKISSGVFIGKKAVINSFAVIGKMAIINTGCIIEHESVVGDFSHVSVGAVLCGNVSVSDHTFIGAGSTVIQGIKIGSSAKIGAGALIIKDVESETTVVGAPGRKIK